MPSPSPRPALVEALNESSAPYRDPLAGLDWSAVDTDCWWLPPSALSLAGVPEFEALPPAARRRLSQWEFVHLTGVGLWLEALFIERLGRELQRTEDPALRSRYLHEIREEAGHSLMFLELARASGLRLPPAALRRPTLAQAAARALSSRTALFWVLVVIGEELPDRLNRQVRKGVEDATLSSIVYHMATRHVIDEARHIAHARATCGERLRELPAWRRRLLAKLAGPLLDAFADHLFYPVPALYEAAGLGDGRRWRAAALASPARSALVAQAVRPTLAFLREAGLALNSRHG